MTPESIMQGLLAGPPGYFVEAGAHDGVGDSQTLALERAGWKGLCVEPSRAFEGLRQSRHCQVDDRALWKLDGKVTFRDMWGEAVELSGIPQCFGDKWDRDGKPFGTRQVTCVTLTIMLQEHSAPQVIDFLVLDTEGSKAEILKAHDFKAYSFKLACVEHNGVEEKKEQIEDVLDLAGMRLLLDDGVNVWWEGT